MGGHASGVDFDYLRYQYDDPRNYETRVRAHALYSEHPGSFREWLIAQIGPAPGESILDAGCGPGTYHQALAARGVRLRACDVSRGMIEAAARQASAARIEVGMTQASVEALPFADCGFDVVMANHMLYHVADQHRALVEMRRVLLPGGRVVLATNGADNCAQFDTLHESAARRLGYMPSVSDAMRFTLDDISLVQSVFPSARVIVRRDAFLFPDAHAAVRYYASYMIDSIEHRPADGSHRPPLARAMAAAVDDAIARAGVFRVTKSAGCFIAEL